mmetsp:Transcript_14508/g.38251  ORF Transcript_14508/g.38251 Transcript_14508/m.38251 type:complete len:257 (-) Transcript_14508:136-906(-)
MAQSTPSMAWMSSNRFGQGTTIFQEPSALSPDWSASRVSACRLTNSKATLSCLVSYPISMMSTCGTTCSQMMAPKKSSSVGNKRLSNSVATPDSTRSGYVSSTPRHGSTSKTRARSPSQNHSCDARSKPRGPLGVSQCTRVLPWLVHFTQEAYWNWAHFDLNGSLALARDHHGAPVRGPGACGTGQRAVLRLRPRRLATQPRTHPTSHFPWPSSGFGLISVLEMSNDDRRRSRIRRVREVCLRRAPNRGLSEIKLQ